MKTKIILALLTLSCFPHYSMGANLGYHNPDKVFSRNMLLKKSDGHLVNVEFRGMKMKVIATTDRSLEPLVDKTFQVDMVRPYFDITAKEGGEGGVVWKTRWSFWPGGEARVGVKGKDRDLAVPIEGKSLKWPIAKGDEAGYQSRRNLLMFYNHKPPRGKHIVSIEAVGHKIRIIRSTLDGIKRLNMKKPLGHKEFKPTGNAHSKPLDLSLNSSVWWIFMKWDIDAWATQDWTFYPDGTARVYERPRSDGVHQIMPW